MGKSFDVLINEIKSNVSDDLSEFKKNAIREKKKSIFLFCSLFVPFYIILFFFLQKHMGFDDENTLPIFLSIIFCSLLLFGFIRPSKNREQYKLLFKENIIKKLISNFYDNVKYTPNSGIPRETYDEAKYLEHYNQFRSEDYIEASLNNKYPVQMAEIKTVFEANDTISTIFHGLFATINIGKSVDSSLFIFPKHSFSKWNAKVHLERNIEFLKDQPLVDIDFKEFNDYFDVCSSNKIIALQLLTHDIMDLLISFKKQTGINYDISICNDKIYLRFYTKNIFEYKSLKSGPSDENTLKRYYNILKLTRDLSTTLIDLIEKTEI